MGDPGYDEPWERLDEVIGHVYKFKDGTGLTISMTFVDSGGHKTQHVYNQCRARLQRRVFAIKGQGGDGVPYTKPPSKVKIVVGGKTIGQTWLYVLGVDAGKADIMASLKVQEPGPRYCHFPKGMERGYDNAFFTGLLSEKLVMKTDRGRTRWAWEKLPGHERNEALDCRNYALAALRILDPDMDRVEARLRQKAESKHSEPVRKTKKRAATNRNVGSGSDW
jgi:phage terminase large subunit GpA-like protein